MTEQRTLGLGPLAPPAMPAVRMDSPWMIRVRVARDRVESAKRELAFKAGTAVRYSNAWRRTCTPARPEGDPALRRTMEAENVFCKRLIVSVLGPAVRQYVDAIDQAMLHGEIRLGGTYSAKWALKEFLDLEAGRQGTGVDEVWVRPSQWARTIDQIAEEVRRALRVNETNERVLKLGLTVLGTAQALGAALLPGVAGLEKALSSVLPPR